MPVPTFVGLPPKPTYEEIANKVNTLVGELQNLLLSLDTLNIIELDAQVILANTITADKLNVTQLSAITANLGTVTAGSLTTDTTVNVGTDATIGNNLYIGDQTTFTDKNIQFSNSAGAGANINYLSGDVSVTVDGNFNVNSGSAINFNSRTVAPTFSATSGIDINGLPVATIGLAGTKVYYVADSSGGAATRKLTFTDGILTSET